jgi:CRP/FNR family transcriptional regulator, cyclic AMP receptor protein
MAALRIAEPVSQARPIGPPEARERRCRVLDELDELGRELSGDTRAAARRAATATVVVLPVGETPLEHWFASTLHGPGLLVVRGLIAREVHVQGRTSAELLGPGDLLRPWDHDTHDPVTYDVGWRVLDEADVALLDAFFADRIRRWPQISADLMGCAIQRAESTAVQRAISCHPRVDVRIAMLLWHLAGRWGRVERDGGLRLPLPLTHRLIGELIGAERPSVTHALHRLAHTRQVVRDDDGWHLHGSPGEAAEVPSRPR